MKYELNLILGGYGSRVDKITIARDKEDVTIE